MINTASLVHRFCFFVLNFDCLFGNNFERKKFFGIENISLSVKNTRLVW